MMKKTFYTNNNKKALEVAKAVIETEGLELIVRLKSDALGDDVLVVSGDAEDMEVFEDVLTCVM